VAGNGRPEGDTVIDLKADDYVVAVWFAQQKRGWDWMACAVRRGGSSDFELLYRHRHGEKDEQEPFKAGQDDKRWITVKLDVTEEPAVLAAVDQRLSDMKLGHVDRVMVRGNADAMMSALSDKVWAHGSVELPLS
jgi:hypothetical protein